MPGTAPAKPERPRAANWFRRDGEAWLLRVHVQPGARASGAAGMHGAALKIRLAARAVDGEANRALLQFVARALGVPVRAVELLRGERSREKTLRVGSAAADPARLAAPAKR